MNDRLKGKKTLQVGILEEFEKDSIKKDINIVGLFHYFGVTLTKKGSSFIGCCPWHNDKNPSLSVDQKKGLYNCFGCGESGDAFTLVEKMKGYHFKESLAFLKEWKTTPQQTAFLTADTSESEGRKQPAVKKVEPEPAQAEKESTGVGETTAPKAEAKAETAPQFTDIERSKYLGIAADYYQKQLVKSKEAETYLEKRGLNDPVLINRFRIGMCNGTLPEKSGEKQHQNFHACGILNDKNTEHFTGCITFPIVDHNDQVVGMYGRRLHDRAKNKHLYVKGEHQGVFHRKASKVYNEIILTESIIDALSLIALGFSNVQALYGINGFTDEHLQVLKNDRVKTVVCAFDNDTAGKAAAEKMTKKLVDEGFQVKQVFPPIKTSNGTDVYFKDWNEYLMSKRGQGVVANLIQNAKVIQPEEATPEGFSTTQDHLGYTFLINGASYRVTGVKEIFVTNLRVNIKAELAGGTGDKYYDNLDLYSARSRSTYSQNMARAFDIEPKRVEKDLITILEYLEEQRDRELAGGREQTGQAALTSQERERGMSFLTSPDMFKEIVDDMEILGYVGEDLNKQLMYIAATSRKLPKPIPVMVLSAPASGKSFLVETVEKMLPPEDLIAVTSLSEQALNYMEDMRHKFLSLGEMVHSETIEHQIRELISKQKLTRLVTQKDQQTGKMVSRPATTEAIVSLAMSGTNHDVNPENASRFFIINTDESQEQTRKIQEAQRVSDELARIYEREELAPAIIAKHQAAQRLITPVKIVNNFSRYLDFPKILMRTRRDNARFIDLIKSVCFLRQYQKEWKNNGSFEYIECDVDDYRIAYDIMVNGVLSASFLEMPRGALDLYDSIREYAKNRGRKQGIGPNEVVLTQRDIREHTGLGQMWVKRHMRILVEYEYLLLQRGGSARSRGYYKLRDDSPMEAVNLTMIPTPEELARRIEEGKRHES